MTTRLAFIVDDFGMSPEVNAAVAKAVGCGAVHGISLMMDQRETAEAVRWALAHPEVPVGLHLNISDRRGAGWEPFAWRGLPAAHRAAGRVENAERFRRETQRQFEAFAATGLRLAFVNGHHHIHIQPVVIAEVRRCLDEWFPGFDGWLRFGENRFVRGDFLFRPAARLFMTRDPEWTGPKTTHLWGSVPPFRMHAAQVLRALDRLEPGFHEFYFHPGADKSRLRDGLPDAGENRRIDFETLCDPRVVERVVGAAAG
ncbi:MAG: ChbG/HpnK family deacetylase [Terrimicrobiaceae bacterium]|nr:ChbG/HpnK family deacetylase [Terrimicrobiaceae bacterium]